jgi:small-conductance mechanosensitive channel
LDILQFLIPLTYFLIIIPVTWLVARFASIIIGRAMRQSMPLVAAEARRLAWLLVWLIGSIFAVEQLGIPPDILLLMVGLFGAGVIVAIREPLENIGARYFTDVYLAFKVGDSISVQGHSGKVIEVNSISTILLADDNQLISIPNSAFMRQVVVNATPQAWKEVSIPITVGSDADLAAFESALLKSCSKLKLHFDRRYPPVLTIKSRNPQSTELTLIVMIRRPEERDAIVAELKRRITEIMETMRRTKK